MSKEAMYTFVPYDEWIATETVDDGEGGTYEQRTHMLYHMYPNARVNHDQTEVVVSCNCENGTHNHAEALAQIAAWNEPTEEP
jgi:hypothetical protein